MFQYITIKSHEGVTAPLQHFGTGKGLAIKRVEPLMKSREDEFATNFVLRESKSMRSAKRHVTHPWDMNVPPTYAPFY